MFDTTRVLVLKRIPYTNNSFVINCYTDTFGRLDVLFRNQIKKSGYQSISVFHPFSLLEAEVQVSPKRSLQRINDFQVLPIGNDIRMNVEKSSIAVFLSEVLVTILQEHEPNAQLFEFLIHSAYELDSLSSNIHAFTVYFLEQLTSFIGIQPEHFTESVRDTATYELDFIRKLRGSTLEQIGNVTRKKQERNRLLDVLLNYYSHFYEGVKHIKSHLILREIFS